MSLGVPSGIAAQHAGPVVTATTAAPERRGLTTPEVVVRLRRDGR